MTGEKNRIFLFLVLIKFFVCSTILTNIFAHPPSLYASLMRYHACMKQDDKIGTYLFFGIPGSGKSNVLFKFLRQKILEEKRHGNGKMTEPPYEVISFNDFNICAGESAA